MLYLDKLIYNPKQIVKQELNLNTNHINKTKYYNELLIKSRYTLAPSGAVPNSIIFWEALGPGSIPILLDDTLELLNINYGLWLWFGRGCGCGTDNLFFFIFTF